MYHWLNDGRVKRLETLRDTTGWHVSTPFSDAIEQRMYLLSGFSGTDFRWYIIVYTGRFQFNRLSIVISRVNMHIAQTPRYDRIVCALYNNEEAARRTIPETGSRSLQMQRPASVKMTSPLIIAQVCEL